MIVAPKRNEKEILLYTKQADLVGPRGLSSQSRASPVFLSAFRVSKSVNPLARLFLPAYSAPVSSLSA